MTRQAGAAAICFDATGTLIEATTSVGEIYRRVALEHGVDLPAWRLDDAFGRILRHAPPRRATGTTREARTADEIEWWFERIRQTFQATDSTVRFDDWSGFARALFDAWASAAAWRIRPGVRETLLALAAQDTFMAVTSNFDHRLFKILEDLELKGFFDLIQVPCIDGHLKPERAVFEAVAARATGIAAAELPADALASMLYVGDDDPDVLARIGELGLRVFDVREVEFGPELADRLFRASRPPTAATLP